MNARLSSLLLLAALVCGCTIDPAIPPRMLRDIEQTTPMCHSSDECAAKMLAAKRWVLQRADLWGLGRQIKDGHAFPEARTILSLDDQGIVLAYWRRMPGAYFSYWIVRATVFGVDVTPGEGSDEIRLRYTSRFQGQTYQSTSTDYDARTSWGETVLAFNRYVNNIRKSHVQDSSKRAEALVRIRNLERSPLSRRANGDRKWLLAWLADDPILGQARYCVDALGPSWKLNYRYAREIETQLLFSGIASVLDRDGYRLSLNEILVAGVRGALRTYRAILEQDRNATQSSLDLLLKKHGKGGLQAYLSSLSFAGDSGRCTPESLKTVSAHCGPRFAPPCG